MMASRVPCGTSLAHIGKPSKHQTGHAALMSTAKLDDQRAEAKSQLVEPSVASV